METTIGSEICSSPYNLFQVLQFCLPRMTAHKVHGEKGYCPKNQNWILLLLEKVNIKSMVFYHGVYLFVIGKLYLINFDPVQLLLSKNGMKTIA